MLSFDFSSWCVLVSILGLQASRSKPSLWGGMMYFLSNLTYVSHPDGCNLVDLLLCWILIVTTSGLHRRGD